MIETVVLVALLVTGVDCDVKASECRVACFEKWSGHPQAEVKMDLCRVACREQKRRCEGKPPVKVSTPLFPVHQGVGER